MTTGRQRFPSPASNSSIGSIAAISSIAALGPIAAIARADARERMRRPAYLVALGAVAWLAWNAVVGNIVIRVGDYRGVYDVAWTGALVSLVATTFLTLAGFYLVKGAIERDATTGVGQILATTPLGRLPYIFGKWLSNLLVLASFLLVLALAAPAMLWLGGEVAAVSPGEVLRHLLLPLLLVALPALALVAAIALLFETLPWLAGGVGNVTYFFLWGIGLAVASQLDCDPLGLQLFMTSMQAAVTAATGTTQTGFALTLRADVADTVGTFVWPGLVWTGAMVRDRLEWIAATALVLGVATLCFDRFAERRSGHRRDDRARTFRRSPFARLARLGGALPGALGAELQLTLAERSTWWWLGLGGLWIAQLVNAPGPLLDMVLPVAWIWPLVAWSSLGGREERAATTGLVWSAAGGPLRLLFASWGAGVAIAVLMVLPALLRLGLAADWTSLTRLAIAALAVPALATACGALSRGPKLFEATYTAAWYIGPMQGASPLDWIGGLGASPGLPLALAALAAAVFTAAAVIRQHRLHTG